jgi:hypothetical protein
MPDLPEQLRDWSQSLGDSVVPSDFKRITSPITSSTETHRNRRWLAVAASVAFLVTGIVAVATFSGDGADRISPVTEPPESYVGSPEHVADINGLLAVAPDAARADVVIFRDYLSSGAIDSEGEPESNSIENWPADVQSASRARTASQRITADTRCSRPDQPSDTEIYGRSMGRRQSSLSLAAMVSVAVLGACVQGA